MCGIFGGYSKNGIVTRELVESGLREIEYRGKDAKNILEKTNKKTDDTDKQKKIVIGHLLHSIVDFVPQPLTSQDSIFAVNCEIYNWKKINPDARNDSEMLFTELEKINQEKYSRKEFIKYLKRTLNKLDGVYACAYSNGETVYLFRDLFGIKPMWYFYHEDLFLFGSERKALIKAINVINAGENEKKTGKKYNTSEINELNPRTIIEFSPETCRIKEHRRTFLKINPEHTISKEDILRKLEKLYLEAIKKRIPDKKIKIGVLFSGGIDSTLLAYTLKKLNIEFTCYTAALDETSQDLIWSRKVAHELGFRLNETVAKIDDIEEEIKTICNVIESSNVVKVGVALPFHLAAKAAKKDGVKILFSGLGSEEIFAGYKRHEDSSNVNEECVSGLLKMYERDLYRDDTITMYNGIEIRLPYLDMKLAKFSLKIPSGYKIEGESKKMILRDLAKKLGLREDFAERKKLAAQYGSRFDKALEILAKKNGFDKKSGYLDQFYLNQNERLGVLFSSGKDSCYAMQVMDSKNYPISCLITIKSKNKDSFMFHTPAIDLTKIQAESLDIPLITIETEGKKEDELRDLEIALNRAKEDYKIEGIVTGALFSNYQRKRIEAVCDRVGLKIFSPLWHMDQYKEFENILRMGFKLIFVKIAGYGLDKSWLGREIIPEDLHELKKLNEKYGVNIAGEGGEFESLVTFIPQLFSKRIEIKGNIVMENEYTGEFIVTDAKLT